QPDALQHKPRGFLSYAKCAMQFVGTNTVFAVGRQPHRGQPFIQTNRGILKDRSNFGRKLLLLMWRSAFPNPSVFKERHLFRSAARATDAIRPANLFEELKSVLWIAEIRDCFQQ